ncbi:MAG: hypothetical protein JWR61_4860 [Ferruginibacter sp.]|nr:hypothetical protein [Ferruginibacter sp.]
MIFGRALVLLFNISGVALLYCVTLLNFYLSVDAKKICIAVEATSFTYNFKF